MEQFKTIHHDAVYENKYVVDQPAYDEPIYESKTIWICNQCGADITHDPVNHNEMHLENYEPGGYHSEKRDILVNTIHHPEQGHNEQVLVKEAWDEKVSAGYKCSCGATK